MNGGPIENMAENILSFNNKLEFYQSELERVKMAKKHTMKRKNEMKSQANKELDGAEATLKRDLLRITGDSYKRF